jgi:hypothetical protein
VNGAVPTTIIVAGLAHAGYALLMTAINRRKGIGLPAALGVVEILLLVLVGIIVARLADGGRPAGPEPGARSCPQREMRASGRWRRRP